MKTIPVALIAFMLAGRVYANPFEIRVSGIVGSGRAVIAPGDLVNISGLPYTVTFIADTESPDHGIVGDANVGAFWDYLGVRVEIGTLGDLSLSVPDALVKGDDGNTAYLTASWGSGVEGVVAISAKTGSFGDPNHLLPFAPLHLTSAPDALVSLGSYDYYAGGLWPRGANSVWFESSASSETPVDVSAVRIPDGGSTLWLFGSVVLSMLLGSRLHCRRGIKSG